MFGKRYVAYIGYLAIFSYVSYFAVDKVIEQLRGRSPNTSGRSYMKAARNGPGKGMVLPFEPLSMSFSEINYYVDMPAVCICVLSFFFLKLHFCVIGSSLLLYRELYLSCCNYTRHL